MTSFAVLAFSIRFQFFRFRFQSFSIFFVLVSFSSFFVSVLVFVNEFVIFSFFVIFVNENHTDGQSHVVCVIRMDIDMGHELLLDYNDRESRFEFLNSWPVWCSTRGWTQKLDYQPDTSTTQTDHAGPLLE